MPAKVTLKDIAREVGVSVTTVSLVLNGRPCRVSDEKRQQVKDAARHLRYVPNQIARSLVTQHSATLGLIVPNIESRFFSSLAKNLEVRCREVGYALFITNSDGTAGSDAELVRLLINRGIDGLFLVTSNDLAPDPELVSLLGQLPMPVVMVDRAVPGAPGDVVRFDNELGGYLACRHLLDAGHRRVACVLNLASNTGRERHAGYLRALAEVGERADDSLVLESDYYIQGGYEAAGRLLSTNATAVFAGSDNIALGLLKRLFEEGRRVPRDLSVVSYDNSAADVLFEPALTSIEQNVGELSDNALGVMLERIRQASAGEASAAGEVLLRPRLVQKDSVRAL